MHTFCATVVGITTFCHHGNQLLWILFFIANSKYSFIVAILQIFWSPWQPICIDIIFMEICLLAFQSPCQPVFTALFSVATSLWGLYFPWYFDVHACLSAWILHLWKPVCDFQVSFQPVDTASFICSNHYAKFTMATFIVWCNHNGNLVCIIMISICIVKCYHGNNAGIESIVIQIASITLATKMSLCGHRFVKHVDNAEHIFCLHGNQSLQHSVF